MANTDTLTAASAARLANKAAEQAMHSQATSDALSALLVLIETDPRFAILREGPTTDRLMADAIEMFDDAEECRMRALDLGYIPE